MAKNYNTNIITIKKSLWINFKQLKEGAVKPPEIIFEQFITKYITKIQGPTQAECNRLADLINKTLQELTSTASAKEKFENILNTKLKPKIVSNIKADDIKLTANLGLSSSSRGAAFGDFLAAKQAYDAIAKENKDKRSKEIEKLLKEQETTMKEAFSRYQAISGGLTTIYGDIGEYFTQAIGELLAKNYSAAIQEENEKAVKKVVKKMQSEKFEFPDETWGTKQTDEYIINFDDAQMKFYGGRKDKVDVSFEAPYLNNNTIFASVKNYSALKNVPLVTGGQLLKLISDGLGGISSNFESFKYIVNALGTNCDWIKQNMLNIKKLIFMSALAGSNVNKANCLIYINRSAKNNPVRILSVKDFFNKIVKTSKAKAFNNTIAIFEPASSGGNINKNFNYPIVKPSGKNGARTDQDQQAILSYTINVYLNKQQLYLNALNT